MGVSSLYRWLVGKYPKIVVNAIQEANCADTSQSNPNGMEFDNLYLDMNGIIHPCFHPEDQLIGPTNFDEVFTSIFEYIDRIFNIVRPRKLLYMAIDGVAPRAKMNQQRVRRFRTAKDAELAEAEEYRLRKEFERAGKEILAKEETEVSDSNVITPGTIFMDKLVKALEYHIRLRLNNDPGWKSIKVILSDANVPGEGEQKIMSFIRSQRNLPGYNSHTRHCLYGLDADLIMLALASHEIYFSVLREDVVKHEQHENVMASLNSNFSRMELDLIKSRQWFPTVFRENSKISKKPHQFLHVWTLRDYLELDMKIMDAPFDIDFERIVDDFIFICFFIGNDFIPNLPTLEIHEGAIDLLITVYKNIFKTNGGYLVNTCRIKERKAAYIIIKRVERFILEVGRHEEKIFEKRYKLQQKKIERLLIQKLEEQSNVNNFESLVDGESGNPNGKLPLNCSDDLLGMHNKGGSSFRDSQSLFKLCKSTLGSSKVDSIERSDVLQNTKELKQKVKDHLRNNADLFRNGFFENDKVKLGCDGWRGRYYREKFSAESPSEIESMRKKIVEKYIEGLCWVLQYYFASVCSWSWYYPFFHGPFASDLRGLVCPPTEFKIGKPFKPFDQLMAVLPPRSCNALPKVYRNLMNSEDSPLIKFYPQDFVVDMDGKRFTWQGVCKLPFIDEQALLNATQMSEKNLKIDEVERNSARHDKIFVRESHALGPIIACIRKMSKDRIERKTIDANSCEINGYISLCHDRCCNSTSPITGTESITEDHVMSAIIETPDCYNHSPLLLSSPPEKTITEADIEERKLWHEYYGPHPHTTKHARNIEGTSKPVPENARERWVSAGSGWSGCGRGTVAVELMPSRGDYGTYGGNFGRGRGFVEAMHYDHRPFRTQASNGGRGFYKTDTWRSMGNSNSFDRGLQRGNGGSQQAGRGRSVYMRSSQ